MMAMTEPVHAMSIYLLVDCRLSFRFCFKRCVTLVLRLALARWPDAAAVIASVSVDRCARTMQERTENRRSSEEVECHAKWAVISTTDG